MVQLLNGRGPGGGPSGMAARVWPSPPAPRRGRHRGETPESQTGRRRSTEPCQERPPHRRRPGAASPGGPAQQALETQHRPEDARRQGAVHHQRQTPPAGPPVASRGSGRVERGPPTGTPEWPVLVARPYPSRSPPEPPGASGPQPRMPLWLTSSVAGLDLAGEQGSLSNKPRPTGGRNAPVPGHGV
jgi:hypothetical protein